MDKALKEVYVAYGKNREVLYVGQGNIGRHKHCNSCCSHVYELNRKHFNKEDVMVEVHLITNDNNEALFVEKNLIVELKPKFNTVHAVCKPNTTDVIRLKSNLDIEIKTYYAKHRKRNEALIYLKHAEHLIDTIGYKNLSHGISLPNKFFSDNLPYFYRAIRESGTHKNIATKMWLFYEVEKRSTILKLKL